MELTDFIFRLLTAAGAGMIIGLERQVHHKTAGLRTHALVAVGSAVFVLVSLELSNGGAGDPTRVIGQVVTGIGFLGAGVIIHQGPTIHGLTTAATIWCSSAIGCMAAAGFYSETLISVGLVVFINFVLFRVDEWIDKISDRQDNTDSNGS
jgi:putative Mg2+ transporter-C (MgtC) family protein